MININEVVRKHPKLNFLQSPAFQALPQEKKSFLLGCVEDALFWVEMEQQGDTADTSFRFLAAHYGLIKAKEEAAAKGIEGKEREKFLQPMQELYLMYNPKDKEPSSH